MGDKSEYDCLLNLVKKRRTVRQFLSDPVPDEYINRIIEVARWAPSAFHTQPWEFVVIKDEIIKNRIVEILEKLSPPIQDPAKETEVRNSYRDAPVFIFQLCDWRAKVGLPGQASSDTARVENLFTSSMANAFLYMHLAAASLGLASQWYTASSRRGVEAAIKGIIGIPEDLTIYDMMVVGYEAIHPQEKIIRDVDEIIHDDNCGPQDFRTDDEVTAYAEITKAWCISGH